jgi:hypothetical protein
MRYLYTASAFFSSLALTCGEVACRKSFGSPFPRQWEGGRGVRPIDLRSPIVGRDGFGSERWQAGSAWLRIDASARRVTNAIIRQYGYGGQRLREKIARSPFLAVEEEGTCAIGITIGTPVRMTARPTPPN